jgi:fructose-1,6-bisphosphatase/inositol monophosphatase family enzyme
MNGIDLNNFIGSMKEAVIEAGKIAFECQGKVENIGKNINRLANDDMYVTQRRGARTIIDDEVQEILLRAAIEIIDTKKIHLDAEEKTSLANSFSQKPEYTTLVIDPIDGTLEYVHGGDSYSINVGLIEEGILIAALVYFPARRELFFADENGVYHKKNLTIQVLKSPTLKYENVIFVNNRVERKIVDELSQKGFQIINDSREGGLTWPNALIKCLKGDIRICIFHTPQIRDVLLGAMISKITGGYARDWLGNKITWPNGGRVPRVLFGFENISEEVLSTLGRA